MKKISIILILLATAGCGSMRMHDAQTSGGMSGTTTSSGISQFSGMPGQGTYPQLDSSFAPYFGD